MAALIIKRLVSVPEVVEANTLYITKNATNATLVDLTFVGTNVADVRRVMGQADVDTAVNTAIAALTADQIPDLPGSKITSAVPEAAKLSPGATINGVAFDGSAAVVVPAVDTETPRVAVADIGTTVASLVDGKIPVAQLPNGLDNINTYDNVAAFPAVGEIDVLYIAKDTNQMYRWSEGEPGEYILIPAGGGTSDTAVKLATPRAIAVAGAVTGSAMFDGSENITINATLTALTAEQIPELPGEKITTAVASALALEVVAEW